MADLFIDSSALIARTLSSDHHHAAARRVLDACPADQVFHLSNYIWDETLTRLQKKAGHGNTLVFARHIRISRVHRLHQITEDLQEEALAIFEQQGPRGGLSFTDCTTVALMRALEFTDIFTFDRAFAALGLTVHP